MDKYETIELPFNVDVSEDVHKRIKAAGIRGLSLEKARELGVYDRISKLLTTYHASIMAAYRVFGNAVALLDSFGGRRYDIAKACNDLDKAYQQFIKFWSDFYAESYGTNEMNEESETLYHNIMRWAQLPEAWQLGGQQRIEDDTDTVIRIDFGDEDRTLRLFKCEIERESSVVGESWCVNKYDQKEHKQYTVETNMDKASAIMVAKRLSDEDTENVYTASQVVDVEKKETVVTPFKSFISNKQVGKTVKVCN